MRPAAARRARRRTVAIASAVAAQRLAELVVSKRHERALRARGAVEHGAGHYPLMVALHACWLAGTVAESWWRPRPLRRMPLAVFLAAQPARVWVIRSLGDRWTTRVLTVPDEEPVAAGPYRWVRHPNYVIVAVEISTLPLAVGAVTTAAVASAANAALLSHRIRIEDRALGRTAAADRRIDGSPGRGTGTDDGMAASTRTDDRAAGRR